MPEYLSPGVYVEETSFRSKSIEGVSTSTAGFVGPTRWGPISGEPELLTSLADFERYFGGLDDLTFDGQTMPNYLAHGVRAFFEEGGQRLFVSRVFSFGSGVFTAPLDANGIPTSHYGKFEITGTKLSTSPTLVARFPGASGNMRVTLTLRAGSNAFSSNKNPSDTSQQIFGLQVPNYSLVHVGTPKTSDPKDRGWTSFSSSGTATDGLFLAFKDTDQNWTLTDDGKTKLLLKDLPKSLQIRPVTVLVELATPSMDGSSFGPSRLLGEFSFDSRNANAFANAFVPRPSTRQNALTIPFYVAGIPAGTLGVDLARALLSSTALGTLTKLTNPPADTRVVYTLAGGSDGSLPEGRNYEGLELEFLDLLDDPKHPTQSAKNGLLAFEAVEDISIVAAPGYSAQYDSDDDHTRVFAVQSAIIDHCEKMRYRIAVLDTPPKQLVSEALEYRNLRSSQYAALYYPWVAVANPLGSGRLNLPPSGFMAGIYARNDSERAVFKAPANEIVRLAVDFEQRINKSQQDILNPEGVNCLRFIDGGFRVWGARTISDDPEWKYVNLRRYFAYLEHSIDRGTQWVVFEPNNQALWTNVRHTIEDFLLNEWKRGALVGDKPDQAYFVRCDMTTMTQNDLDNGRLVCLVGVAAVRPAEFVIFRVGQWTATTNN